MRKIKVQEGEFFEQVAAKQALRENALNMKLARQSQSERDE